VTSFFFLRKNHSLPSKLNGHSFPDHRYYKSLYWNIFTNMESYEVKMSSGL